MAGVHGPALDRMRQLAREAVELEAHRGEIARDPPKTGRHAATESIVAEVELAQPLPPLGPFLFGGWSSWLREGVMILMRF